MHTSTVLYFSKGPYAGLYSLCRETPLSMHLSFHSGLLSQPFFPLQVQTLRLLLAIASATAVALTNNLPSKANLAGHPAFSNWSGLSRSAKYELTLQSHRRNRTPWAAALTSYWTSTTIDNLNHFSPERRKEICVIHLLPLICT